MLNKLEIARGTMLT